MTADSLQQQKPIDSRRQNRVAQALRRVLPTGSVLTQEEELRPYECDGLSAYRELPMVVALPATIAEIKAVLKIANKHNVAVVTRGAGTSLSGGALPRTDGILMSLAKLNQILEIDPLGRTARVQPGVRNLAISEAVAKFGLFYAPDPSSQIACSIGGNVAENAGGVHCLKYGLTVHNILKLEIITIDGECITVGADALDSPGYDLLALFTGSEGMLGVIAEITVRLLPKPERVQVLLASYDSVEVAGRAVSEIIAAGIIPAGLEMMDNPAICAAEEFVHAGYPVDAAAILLCELDGTNDDVSQQVYQVRKLLLANGATKVRTAETEEERQRMWAGRKGAFPAVGRISPDYYCMDGTIPRRHLPEVLGRIAELSEQYNLRVANVFHAGDGNLHPLILYDANIPGELQRTEEFGARICELSVEMGGTITGEHGVGVEKIDQMCMQFSANELSLFHGIKQVFDAGSLLNPGKAVPSLHRCAELGAMHVHHGKLPHPEIERF